MENNFNLNALAEAFSANGFTVDTESSSWISVTDYYLRDDLKAYFWIDEEENEVCWNLHIPDCWNGVIEPCWLEDIQELTERINEVIDNMEE